MSSPFRRGDHPFNPLIPRRKFVDAFQQLAILQTAGRHRPFAYLQFFGHSPILPSHSKWFSVPRGSANEAGVISHSSRLESRKCRGLIGNQVQDGAQPHHLQQHPYTIIGTKEC